LRLGLTIFYINVNKSIYIVYSIVIAVSTLQDCRISKLKVKV